MFYFACYLVNNEDNDAALVSMIQTALVHPSHSGSQREHVLLLDR